MHLFWMLSFQDYEIRTTPDPGFSASPLVEGERTKVRGLGLSIHSGGRTLTLPSPFARETRLRTRARVV
jgi:hypothetical protein